MGRWSWARVIAVAVVYVAAVGIARVAYTTLRLEADAKRAGLDLANTYVLQPSAPAWWPLVLLGPPVAFLVWRAVRGRNDRDVRLPPADS